MASESRNASENHKAIFFVRCHDMAITIGIAKRLNRFYIKSTKLTPSKPKEEHGDERKESVGNRAKPANSTKRTEVLNV